jgi:hypothetical protein
MTYTDQRSRILNAKYHSVPNIAFLKMASLSSNELETEPALLK